MKEAQPISKASFVLAFAEHNAASYKYCSEALDTWADLHRRKVLKDEIDEDPVSP